MYILVLNFFMVSNMYDQCSHCFQMYLVNINTSYETVRCGYLSDWSPRAGWAEVSLAAHEDVDVCPSCLWLCIPSIHRKNALPSPPVFPTSTRQREGCTFSDCFLHILAKALTGGMGSGDSSPKTWFQVCSWPTFQMDLLDATELQWRSPGEYKIDV